MTDMTDGMFGGMDLDELTSSIPKGTYRLKLDDVTDKEATTEYGEADRRFKIFNFSIADERKEIEDWDGERVKGIFLNYWPNLQEQKDLVDKSQLRNSAKIYKTLAKALGVEEEVIQSGKVPWEDYEGTYVYATIFPSKPDGDPQIQTNSIVNEASVEI